MISALRLQEAGAIATIAETSAKSLFFIATGLWDRTFGTKVTLAASGFVYHRLVPYYRGKPATLWQPSVPLHGQLGLGPIQGVDGPV